MKASRACSAAFLAFLVPRDAKLARSLKLFCALGCSTASPSSLIESRLAAAQEQGLLPEQLGGAGQNLASLDPGE
jgi:hypothetical protein